MDEDNALDLRVHGIPKTVPEAAAAVCRSRLLTAFRDLAPELDTTNAVVAVGTAKALEALAGRRKAADPEEPAAARYEAVAPRYRFEHLVVPDTLRVELVAAVELLRVAPTVFDTWGLREVEPFPRTALNFHGPPGTGKTLAAHSLAERLGRKILVASYAEIESKFHGDGPKNVKALFQAAESQGAVLFIDEADSLLSRRLTNVTQGSEQAINSMRSQLLICLEQFSGVVIFSTNLVENYDRAFETRVRHVAFLMPDEPCRAEIWRKHLVPALPVAADVDPAVLAARLNDVCGRDIKNALVDAAVRTALANAPAVTLEELVAAVERIKAARVAPRPLSACEKTEVAEKVKAAHARQGTAGQGETEPAAAG